LYVVLCHFSDLKMPGTKQKAAFDIYNLLTQGMGLELHWFPEDVSVSRLAAVMVGMANTSGGTILIGIAPRSGHVQGIFNAGETIDKVFQAAVLVDPPLVLPVPTLRKIGPEQVDVLSIIVPRGLPNLYSFEGRFLCREGRQTNPLGPRKLRELLIERGSIHFENRVPQGASLDDLDWDQVENYLSVIGISGERQPEEALFRRGCLQRVDGELLPSYAAVLLFGRFPQQYVPSASILAARFPGITFSDAYVKQDLRGTLPDQLKKAEIFIRENMRSKVKLIGLQRQETSEYPFDAVRELLVNAVAHRDYNVQGDSIHLNIFNDRLEVQSPGLLPGPVTLDNLLESRFSRNAVIVQILSDLGYIERLGYGLNRVVHMMQQHNLRHPKFDESAGCFRATLFGSFEEKLKTLPDLEVYHSLDLNPRQQMALTYLAVHKRINSGSYQDLCQEVHTETLRRDLADMVKKGILIKIGDKRSTYYILK
jgi:ATP-dependent DNA helicase RecG